MNRPNLTSSARRRVAAAGLAVAAAGIELQIAGGADYPAVPPGLVILLAAAALLLWARWTWALVLATLAGAFIGVGAALAPNLRDQLADPAAVLTFAGSVLQLAGLALGLGACLAAFRERSRTPALQGWPR